MSLSTEVSYEISYLFEEAGKFFQCSEAYEQFVSEELLTSWVLFLMVFSLSEGRVIC